MSIFLLQYQSSDFRVRYSLFCSSDSFISLQYLKNQIYELSVKDDGIGFPVEIDPNKTKSMGLRLVNILTDQICGKVTFYRTKGTAVKIQFERLLIKEEIQLNKNK